MAVVLTRLELNASELRREAKRCRDTAAARRMLALALVLEGHAREAAARHAGMDRQTLRDWVHRYNAEGLAGLQDRRHPGPTPRLTPEQMAELATIVANGPDPERDGVVRWRRVDLQAVIGRRFGVHLHERLSAALTSRRGIGQGRWWARSCAGSASPACRCARSIPRAILRRKKPTKNFAQLVKGVLPAHAAGRPIEIWFADEARVGQQGTLTRIRARRGTRPRAPRDRRYAWAYLFGAVCPERAIGAALVLPFVNAEAMNLHLQEISRHVRPGAHAVLVLDGAGWHGAAALDVPDNLTLLPLPSYSPELNPVENVWGYLRQNQLSLRVWPDYEAIVDTCCQAWNALMALPGRIASITRREWAKPVSS